MYIYIYIGSFLLSSPFSPSRIRAFVCLGFGCCSSLHEVVFFIGCECVHGTPKDYRRVIMGHVR